jgi:hypothetical protein
MSSLAIPTNVLLPPSFEMVSKLDQTDAIIRECPQVEVITEHVIHGGMYARTIRRAPGIVAVGSLILKSTLLIISGDCTLIQGDGDARRFTGYNVFAGLAGRKSCSMTHGPVEMTMIFATQAETVEEAEEQLFGEVDRLMSRQDGSKDLITITGV